MRKLFIALAIIVVIAVCVIVLVYKPDNPVARIYHFGELIDTIELSKVHNPYEIEIIDKDGAVSNVVEVEPGRIRVVFANCPDHICVKRGWSSGNPMPIACLPNELIITLA